MRAWIFGQAVGFSFFKLFTDFYTKSYKKDKGSNEKDTTKNSDSDSLRDSKPQQPMNQEKDKST